jgi:antigen flippase
MGQSYSNILKASAITAGSAVMAMGIGLVATKLLSVAIGPEGLGELRLFQSVLAFVGYVIGLGTGASAVRAISAAHGRLDGQEVARLAWLFRRVSLAYGVVGALGMVALSGPISVLVFDSADRAGHIALLGIAIFLAALQAGEALPLQGIRQVAIGARISVFGALATAIVTVGFALSMGRAGIVPALILSALAGFVIAWMLRRSVPFGVPSSRATSRRELFDWARLGMSSMGVDSIAQGCLVALSAAVVHAEGIGANGIYLAAWGVSGVFATFVLSAMAADFYPRLAAVQDDRVALSRTINAQIEVGVLMALPGLLPMLCFAPEVVRLLYSSDFGAAGSLMPWFLLYAFLRVVWTPIAYVFPAIGAGALNFGTQSVLLLSQLALSLAGLHVAGLPGLAIGVLIAGAASTMAFAGVARVRVGFVPSLAVLRLVVTGVVLLVVAAFVVESGMSPILRGLAGIMLTTCASLLCFRGLVLRLGRDHRLARGVLSIRPLAWVVDLSLPAKRGKGAG